MFLKIVLLSFNACSFFTAPLLKFRNDNTFTLLQLTDLHLGEDENLDSLTRLGIINMLEASNPDVVVITGDLVSDYSYHGLPDFF